MPQITPGTRAHPDRGYNAWMTNYTDEQLATLETLKTGVHVHGIARDEHANQILLPDGRLTNDLDAMRTAAQENVRRTAAELLAATRATRPAARAAANAAQDLVDEIEDHIAQQRFLFIVDESLTPRIYFQCAVEGNPDTPMLTSEHTEEHVERMEQLVAEAAAKDAAAREEAKSKLAAAALAAKTIATVLLALIVSRTMSAAHVAHQWIGLAIGAISYKVSTGNYYLDQLYDNKFPATSILEIRSGAAAGPDNAAGGSLGVSITLPATPWAAAASKSKAKSGTWSAAASGTITGAHFRLKNAGDTEREEGTVSTSGADLNLDNTSINSGQTVTISTFTRTAP